MSGDNDRVATIQTVEHRNTVAVQAALDAMSRRSDEQQQRIDGLVATVGTLQGRVDELERGLLVARAVAAGHGPTAR